MLKMLKMLKVFRMVKMLKVLRIQKMLKVLKIQKMLEKGRVKLQDDFDEWDVGRTTGLRMREGGWARSSWRATSTTPWTRVSRVSPTDTGEKPVTRRSQPRF